MLRRLWRRLRNWFHPPELEQNKNAIVEALSQSGTARTAVAKQLRENGLPERRVAQRRQGDRRQAPLLDN